MQPPISRACIWQGLTALIAVLGLLLFALLGAALVLLDRSLLRLHGDARR
ncbi:hypothetical protein [Metallibacterium sp.]|jgi:hypothetical protein|nr:hypothetical protein [Metallibacterium sp.]